MVKIFVVSFSEMGQIFEAVEFFFRVLDWFPLKKKKRTKTKTKQANGYLFSPHTYVRTPPPPP